MKTTRRILGGLAVGAVALPLSSQVAGATAPVPAPSPAQAQADAAQASLVANEDARIIDIRSVGALARAQRSTLIDAPYRLRTGSTYTLVLTPRTQAYTVDDLLRLAPQTFVRQSSGAYLLSENLYVEQGATLQLKAGSAPLRVEMQSDPAGFVSIVSFGGTLDFEGSATAPVTIISYDPTSGGPDRTVADGRAYVRSIGGTATFSYVHASDLGFWSGRTGGVAITGNDRPHVGLLGAAPATAQTYGANHHYSHYALRKGAAAPAPTGAPAPVPPQQQSTPAGNGAIQPAGPLNPNEQGGPQGSPFQYVGGAVRNSSFDGDAFGLFVSGAKNFVITDSSFSHNLYTGLVVHRYVTGAVLQRDVATANGADGFDVTRAANGVQMLDDTASHNTAVGFSVNGNPLATAESAAGMPLTAYGNHKIADSTATGNGVAGIEITGAQNTTVESNSVSGSPMGIVVRGTARGVRVVSNRVSGAAKHGISIRDGVSGAVIAGNTVDKAATGIYVRASVATVSHNTVDGGAAHAISMVGDVGRSSVTYNTLSGTGDGAIDTYRVSHPVLTVANNDVSGWVDLRSWTRHLKQLLSPLTLLWVAVIGLIVATAVRGRRRRDEKLHPYANTVPLSSIVNGALDVASVDVCAPGAENDTIDLTAADEPAPGGLWVPGRHAAPALLASRRGA